MPTDQAVEIERLKADNAALLKEFRQVHRWANKNRHGDLAVEIAQLLGEPHPGMEILNSAEEQRQALTMALHMLDAYEEQAAAAHVVVLTPDGVSMLQALIARLRKVLK